MFLLFSTALAGIDCRIEKNAAILKSNLKAIFFLVVRTIVQSLRIAVARPVLRAYEIRKQFQYIPYVRG